MQLYFTRLLALAATPFAFASTLHAEPANDLVSRAQSQTYTNPVLWEDLADLDVFRVNDTYYYSASTMAFSPGAPILTSKDLVNWEYVGHSVPVLDFGDKDSYSLNNGKQAYVRVSSAVLTRR
jgi:beta-xylosidase